jgi:ribonuclease HII
LTVEIYLDRMRGMKGVSIAELKERLARGEVSDAALKKLARSDRKGVRELAKRTLERRRRELEDAANEADRLHVMLHYERELWAQGLRVCGVDEVGVGPLAGPVVAAAVILPAGCSIEGINDSKQLTHEERAAVVERIKAVAEAFAVASCSTDEIETLNIYHASLEAMRRAVAQLSPSPDHLLVDARTVPGVVMRQTPLIKGDTRSQSIAAASILAKVARDDIMDELATVYPGYGFESHRGYSTPEHFAAIEALGPCPIHRRSFAPIAEALGLRPRQMELIA